MRTQASHLASLPAVAITLAPNARPSMIAVEPRPLVPPCTSSVSPACETRAAEHVLPDGEHVLRQRRGFVRAPVLRDRQHLLLRRDGVLGVAAARQQRAHRVAGLPARHALARRRHASRHFQAGHVGRARRRRMHAAALQRIRAADADRLHADQHFRRPGTGSGRVAMRNTLGGPKPAISTTCIEVGKPIGQSSPRAAAAVHFRLACRAKWRSAHDFSSGSRGCRCAVTLGIDFDGPSHEVGRGIAPLGINRGAAIRPGAASRGTWKCWRGTECPARSSCPATTRNAIRTWCARSTAAGFEVAAHGYLHEAWDLEARGRDPAAAPDRRHPAPAPRQADPGLALALGAQDGEHHARAEVAGLHLRLQRQGLRPALPAALRRRPGRLHRRAAEQHLQPRRFPVLQVQLSRRPRKCWRSGRASSTRSMPGDRFMVLTVHPRSGWGSGTPARTAVLEQMIGYMKGARGRALLLVGPVRATGAWTIRSTSKS